MQSGAGGGCCTLRSAACQKRLRAHLQLLLGTRPSGSLPDPPVRSCTLRRRWTAATPFRTTANRRFCSLWWLEQRQVPQLLHDAEQAAELLVGMSRIRSATSFILTQMGPPTNRRLNWASCESTACYTQALDIVVVRTRAGP
jgi:hypothetical protein